MKGEKKEHLLYALDFWFCIISKIFFFACDLYSYVFSSQIISTQGNSRRFFPFPDKFFWKNLCFLLRYFQKHVISALNEINITITVNHCKTISMVCTRKYELSKASNTICGRSFTPPSIQISGRIVPSFRFPRNGTPTAFRTSRFT